MWSIWKWENSGEKELHKWDTESRIKLQIWKTCVQWGKIKLGITQSTLKWEMRGHIAAVMGKDHDKYRSEVRKPKNDR